MSSVPNGPAPHVSANKDADVIWQPTAECVDSSRLSAFCRFLVERRLASADLSRDYASLHRWSVAAPEDFWSAMWDFSKVIGERGGRALDDPNAMPSARWFPGARLNFAENLLRRRDDSEALVFWGEDRMQERMTTAELYRQVAHLAAALRDQGVVAGDRVAAYMPNMPETLIAMLASASIGAIFTSASPDFGAQGVLDRFGQTEPKVLIAADGYYYNGKTIDLLDKLGAIVAALPSVQRTVVVRYVHQEHDLSSIRGAVMLGELIADYRYVDEIEFARLPFSHPLYIMYSSGTTGVPKCIVHGAGGTLLQHLKEHQLHGDVRPGDRLFYFTTCGWMMWNWLMSGLASEATLLLYDGSPFADHGAILFDFAESEHMSHFGTSAKFIDAVAKAGHVPASTHDLKSLRAMFSTGSPLAPESYDFVYRAIKSELQLASISGGTDIVSCFVLGNPNAGVRRGEIQCAGLGMDVRVVDEAGVRVVGEKGELVCARPFPSMPLGFWNDPGDVRYMAAYFERFPGIWCHGDYAEETASAGFVIYGRSDATLNPGGVRIGTAEIYRQVEQMPEILESLVISQDWPPASPGQAASDVRIVLFVRLREGIALDAALEARIRNAIRAQTTPRHVPERIVQVTDIPRTKSGKIVELAVRNVVHGEAVKNLEALANPDALEQYRERTELAV